MERFVEGLRNDDATEADSCVEMLRVTVEVDIGVNASAKGEEAATANTALRASASGLMAKLGVRNTNKQRW